MDNTCILIKKVTRGFDKYGNPLEETREREVFCQVFGVNRSEFYSAATVDLNPELTIRLSDFMDYEDEKLVRLDGRLYSVIRTYRDSGSLHRGGNMNPNAIELIVERKIGNGIEECGEPAECCSE